MGNFYNWLHASRASSIAQDAEFKPEDHPRNDKGGTGGGRFRTSSKTIEKEDGIEVPTDEKGRPLRLDNIQGFCDADGTKISVGDTLEQLVGVEKGKKDKVIGFKGDKIYLDSGWTIHRSYCNGTRIVK